MRKKFLSKSALNKTTIRLDKYIASVTDYSRNEVKRLLKNDHVRVNGIPASNPAAHINQQEDTVAVYEQVIDAPQARYFMLNKPRETVCATEDSEHTTVLDLIDEPNLHKLHIAGRLDKDTTGLVLITDDGQWSHQVTSPRSECFKRYRVYLAQDITDDAITALKQGVQLHNEKKLTLPAHIDKIDNTTILISIQEGKYHQVKRMLAAVGNHVEHLHREAVGKIELDKELELGQYRELHHHEAALFLP